MTRRQRYKVTSIDPASMDPRVDAGWGKRTDEFLALPSTLWQVFNGLFRDAPMYEVLAVELVKPLPRKLACAQCGGPIEQDRIELRLKRCLACVAPEPDVVDPDHGHNIGYAPETRVLHTPDCTDIVNVPVHEFRVMRDYWLVEHAFTPIPGEAKPQRSVAGHLRTRVVPDGKIRPNPWDRKPRDRGRRDFENPTAEKGNNRAHAATREESERRARLSGNLHAQGS